MGCANKTRFKDKLQALGALHTIANKEDKRENSPQRTYYCTNCFGWHLTKSDILVSGDSFHLKHIKLWNKLLKK